MSSATHSVLSGTRFHRDAYQFVFLALQHTQRKLDRIAEADEEDAHVSGPELLEGIRELALKNFGLLTQTVFSHWGVKSTGDFGRIVFEMIERGEMKKTDRDQYTDFLEVYDFAAAFDHDYQIDTSSAYA